MEMKVNDHFLSDGNDSGSKTYQKNTPSVSIMYAFTPDLHGYVSAGKGFETRRKLNRHIPATQTASTSRSSLRSARSMRWA